VKDRSCRFTKTEIFQRQQRGLKADEHQQFYEELVDKSLPSINDYGLPVCIPSLPQPKSLPALGTAAKGDNYQVQEMLRLKAEVIQSIKQREALILQLDAVVLCWPKKRPSNVPLGKTQSEAYVEFSGLRVTPDQIRAHETLRSLVGQIRRAGVRTIEKVAAWMLHVGTDSRHPPQFKWNGQSYLRKMHSDLDFVASVIGPEEARNFNFHSGNPLLIGTKSKASVRTRAAMALLLDVVKRLYAEEIGVAQESNSEMMQQIAAQHEGHRTNEGRAAPNCRTSAQRAVAHTNGQSRERNQAEREREYQAAEQEVRPARKLGKADLEAYAALGIAVQNEGASSKRMARDRKQDKQRQSQRSQSQNVLLSANNSPIFRRVKGDELEAKEEEEEEMSDAEMETDRLVRRTRALKKEIAEKEAAVVAQKQKEAVERAKEKKRKEAADHSRRVEEEAKKQADEQAKKQADEQAKKAAEEARKQAEERAKRQAEERAKREAEEQAKQQEAEKEKKAFLAQERARKQAEDKAMKQAEEQTKKEAVDQVLRSIGGGQEKAEEKTEVVLAPLLRLLRQRRNPPLSPTPLDMVGVVAAPLARLAECEGGSEKRDKWLRSLVAGGNGGDGGDARWLVQLLQKVVDSVLNPVLDEAEAQLQGGSTMHCTWAEAGIAEVSEVLDNSVRSTGGRETLAASARPCCATLQRLRDLLPAPATSKSTGGQSSGGDHGLSAEGTFESESINRLVNLLCAPLMDGQLTSACKIQHLELVEQRLGLPSLANHAALLSASSKRLLLHLWLTRQHVHSVSLIMARETAFNASFELLLSGGYLHPIPTTVLDADAVLDAVTRQGGDAEFVAERERVASLAAERMASDGEPIVSGIDDFGSPLAEVQVLAPGTDVDNDDSNFSSISSMGSDDSELFGEEAPVLKSEQELKSLTVLQPRLSPCIISPYFKSSFGAKSAGGEAVEEGEGHGPRKEFFALLSQQLNQDAGAPMHRVHALTSVQRRASRAIALGSQYVSYSIAADVDEEMLASRADAGRAAESGSGEESGDAEANTELPPPRVWGHGRRRQLGEEEEPWLHKWSAGKVTLHQGSDKMVGRGLLDIDGVHVGCRVYIKARKLRPGEVGAEAQAQAKEEKRRRAVARAEVQAASACMAETKAEDEITPFSMDEDTEGKDEGGKTEGSKEDGVEAGGGDEQGDEDGVEMQFTVIRVCSDCEIVLSSAPPPVPAGYTLKGVRFQYSPPQLLPLFEWRKGSEALWFPTDSSTALIHDSVNAARYTFIGFLMACVIANQCTLDVSLPTILFKKLLCSPTSSARGGAGGGSWSSTDTDARSNHTDASIDASAARGSDDSDGGSSNSNGDSKSGTHDAQSRRRISGPSNTFRPTLEDMRGFDIGVHKSMSSIYTMGDDDFAAVLGAEGSDESNESNENDGSEAADAVDGESDGAKSDGANGAGVPDVSTRDAFVQRSLDDLLITDCEWQYEALRCGFQHIIPLQWLQHLRLSPSQLQQVICGQDPSKDLDFVFRDVFRYSLFIALLYSYCTNILYFRDVFRIETDRELLQCEPLHSALWAVVQAFPVPLKRKFLTFVTGINQLPAKQTEFLKVEMPFIAVGLDEHQQLLHMLPQSHTCDNILELPNYWEALVYLHLERTQKRELSECTEEELQGLKRQLYSIVHQKLKTAAENSEGYGLDSLAFEISSEDEAIAASLEGFEGL
jgi:actin-related protein